MQIASALQLISALKPSSSSVNLDNVPAEQKPLLQLQAKLAKEEELVTLMSNTLKKLHEMNMAIINNMR